MRAHWILLLIALLCGCQRGGVPMPRQVVDLTPALAPDLNLQRLGTRVLGFLGTEARVRSTPVVPSDPTFAWGLRTLELMSHTGAHLDTPSRLLRGGETPASVDLADLFGPARVIDLRWHNRHTPIQITDLELKPIRENEIVILFVGYEVPAPGEWPRYAPLSTQAAEYLVAKKIRALATDLPAIVRFDEIETRMTRGLPPEEIWAEYLPLFQAGIPIVAGLVNLDVIVKEPNVAFAGFPLSLPVGDGAPMRAAALIY